MGAGVVDGDSAAKVFGAVVTGAVDQQGVEEEGVAGVHLEVHPQVDLDALGPEEQEVLVLPVGVVVLQELAGVGARDDHQAAVLPGDLIERRPDADDVVGGTEREVEQVLVEGVAAVDVGGLVEVHAVQGDQVVADELGHLGDDRLVVRMAGHHRVAVHEVHLGDAVRWSSGGDQPFGNLNIAGYLHVGGLGDGAVGNIGEPLVEGVDHLSGHQLAPNEIAVSPVVGFHHRPYCPKRRPMFTTPTSPSF